MRTLVEGAGGAHVVAGVHLYPKWEDRDEDDIALVHLEEPVTGVDPIPIYRGSDELGAVITLVGRGTDLEGVGAAGDSGYPAFLDVDGTRIWPDSTRGATRITVSASASTARSTTRLRLECRGTRAGWTRFIESRAESGPKGDDHTGAGWSRVGLGSIVGALLVIGAAVALRWLRARARGS